MNPFTITWHLAQYLIDHFNDTLCLVWTASTEFGGQLMEQPLLIPIGIVWFTAILAILPLVSLAAILAFYVILAVLLGWPLWLTALLMILIRKFVSRAGSEDQSGERADDKEGGELEV